MAKKNKKFDALGYDAVLDRWKNNELIKNDYIYIADVMRRFEGSLEFKILRAYIETVMFRLHAYPKKAEDHSYVLGKLDGLVYVNEAVKILKKFAENIPKREREEEQEEIPLANEEASIE